MNTEARRVRALLASLQEYQALARIQGEFRAALQPLKPGAALPF